MTSLVQAVLQQRGEEHEARMRNIRPFDTTQTAQCLHCPTVVKRKGTRGRFRRLCGKTECRNAYKREQYARSREADHG